MRGHPRTPQAIARATGRIAVNPGRFKGRKEPKSRPLGAASSELSFREKVMWKRFQKEWHWLTEADRGALEIGCKLRAVLLDGGSDGKECGIQRITAYKSWLSTMGGTPGDRSKITAPGNEEAEEDPADAYLN